MKTKTCEQTAVPPAPSVLDTRAAAAYLAVSPRTLEGVRVRVRGGAPRRGVRHAPKNRTRRTR